MNIAVGSLYEVRSMIYLWRDRLYFSWEESEKIFVHNLQTIQLTLGFLRYLHAYKKNDSA